MTDARHLVESLGATEDRFGVYRDLVTLGAEALPAVREGLKSRDKHVRHWSLIVMDRLADSESLLDVIPLLQDPVDQVRIWAVHTLACNHCRDGVECPVDVVPHILERAERDASLRVRNMAVIMLSRELSDRRAIPVLESVLEKESDSKIRLHAQEGLERLGRS